MNHGARAAIRIVTGIGVSLLAAAPALAHPVSYQGAVGVMAWNQPYLSDYWVTYSFRPDAALAARGMRMQMKDGRFVTYMPQFDYLVKRWNENDHQANLYAYGGWGGARFENRDGTAGLLGLEADAESRKYFVMAKAEGMRPTVGSNFNHAELRAGIAPYEAEYNEIASWLMLQLQWHPALVQGVAITPLARVFYRNFLFEAGVSLDGDAMFNMMFHF